MVIDVSGGRLTLDSRGFLRVEFDASRQITEADVAEMHSVLIDRIGTPMPVLIDTRKLTSMTRAARRRSADDSIADHLLRLAVLQNSAVGTVIANFVIRVQRPRYEVRMFSDEATAIAWLLPTTDG